MALGPGQGARGDPWLPVRLEFDTERRLRIAAVLDSEQVRGERAKAELAAAALVRGERVTHWDGRELDELLDAEIRPWICASTPQGSDLQAARQLASGPRGSQVTLRVVRADGSARDVTLHRARYPVPARGSQELEVRELRGGVLYFCLPSFSSRSSVEGFERELERVRRASALIFDVRANGGGNSRHGWDIVRCLIDRPIPTTAWRTRQYRPAHRAWGQEEEWYAGEPGKIEPAAEPFLGPVAVLVGPETFSAAEDFVAVLHASERATIVGRPTGGSTGQPLRIELPGGGGARICTKRDTYPDGREFVGVGIQPDVVVDPLLATDREDPELERALEIVEAAAKKK
jgi:C-terminal processing protease CtpA/Prc